LPGARCYAVEDRTWLDEKLVGIFGLRGKRVGIIAVTTQAAEQSLDIDADLLVTAIVVTASGALPVRTVKAPWLIIPYAFLSLPPRL
jgi:hypothetical protein